MINNTLMRLYFSICQVKLNAGTSEMRAIIPDATILFGVHATGSEERRARIPPERVSQNTVRLSSITRVHEVAFFDEYAKPIEVRTIDQKAPAIDSVPIETEQEPCFSILLAIAGIISVAYLMRIYRKS